MQEVDFINEVQTGISAKKYGKDLYIKSFDHTGSAQRESFLYSNLTLGTLIKPYCM